MRSCDKGEAGREGRRAQVIPASRAFSACATPRSSGSRDAPTPDTHPPAPTPIALCRGHIGAGDRGADRTRGAEARRAVGSPGPQVELDSSDYKRIVGVDAVKEEAELARRSHSHKRGRWEKKLAAVHQSLENFTPEVKTGNQTALGTKAAPFALYIAKMHRTIHELWGFGFLEDLDSKASSNAMNKRELAVKIEIVLNPDGTLDRAPTIVRPSGVLTFDVAAMDTS